MKTEPFQLSSPERTRELDRQLYADHLAQQHAERRERIATAALQGLVMMFQDGVPTSEVVSAKAAKTAATTAVKYADALISALDSKDTP